uniref:SH3 domain-containing protein n=1 Tax=Anolis carolinensis TaxID=28377 RepID=A0A803TEC3_ANOCA
DIKSNGWWLGKKRGQLGVFPSNFVQELSDPSLVNMARVFACAPDPPSFSPFQHLLPFLLQETVDLGWWEGESRGKKGLFPDNFVMPPLPSFPQRLVSLQIKSKVPTRKKEAGK